MSWPPVKSVTSNSNTAPLKIFVISHIMQTTQPIVNSTKYNILNGLRSLPREELFALPNIEVIRLELGNGATGNLNSITSYGKKLRELKIGTDTCYSNRFSYETNIIGNIPSNFNEAMRDIRLNGNKLSGILNANSFPENVKIDI